MVYGDKANTFKCAGGEHHNTDGSWVSQDTRCLQANNDCLAVVAGVPSVLWLRPTNGAGIGPVHVMA